MALTLQEMETLILFNRAEDGAEIYTADPVMIRRLDKLTQTSEFYRKDPGHPDDLLNGEVIAKSYLLKDKNMISFRKVKQAVTEAQRAARRMNAAALRAQTG